jgi:hypothetical protein
VDLEVQAELQFVAQDGCQPWQSMPPAASVQETGVHKLYPEAEVSCTHPVLHARLQQLAGDSHTVVSRESHLIIQPHTSHPTAALRTHLAVWLWDQVEAQSHHPHQWGLTQQGSTSWEPSGRSGGFLGMTLCGPESGPCTGLGKEAGRLVIDGRPLDVGEFHRMVKQLSLTCSTWGRPHVGAVTKGLVALEAAPREWNGFGPNPGGAPHA